MMGIWLMNDAFVCSRIFEYICVDGLWYNK